MSFFNRKKKLESEETDPAYSPDFDLTDSTTEGFFEDNISGIDINQSAIPQNQENDNEENIQDDEEEMMEDDSENIAYSEPYQKEENTYPKQDYDEETDEFYNDDELQSSPEDYFNQPKPAKATNVMMHQYQSIGSEEQAYDLISGIGDVPLKYRDDNYIPELVMPSLQYNNIKGFSDLAEWQIKGRSLIRKHQMYNPDFKLSGRDVAGITYINDALLWRAVGGFERKMSIQNIQGTLEELNTEASPNISQPKKKGILGGLFG